MTGKYSEENTEVQATASGGGGAADLLASVSHAAQDVESDRASEAKGKVPFAKLLSNVRARCISNVMHVTAPAGSAVALRARQIVEPITNVDGLGRDYAVFAATSPTAAAKSGRSKASLWDDDAAATSLGRVSSVGGGRPRTADDTFRGRRTSAGTLRILASTTTFRKQFPLSAQWLSQARPGTPGAAVALGHLDSQQSRSREGQRQRRRRRRTNHLGASASASLSWSDASSMSLVRVGSGSSGLGLLATPGCKLRH